MNPPDYELPTDSDSANDYVVIVSAQNSEGISSQSITVSVTDVDDTGPLITGPSGSIGASSISTSVIEKEYLVGSFKANETVTWSIGGGADADKFYISTNNLEMWGGWVRLLFNLSLIHI